MRRFNVQRLPFEAPKAFALCLALIITAWFLAQSWRGLTVFFTGDDIMNIYWSCEASWTRLLTANLTPFTTEYRPLGALLYRALFETFGLNPLPFRLLFYSLMLANTFLCFQLARLLKIDVDRVFFRSIDEVGHIISSDNVVNLMKLERTAKVRPGAKLLLFMAGFGLNWQSVVLEKV